MTTQEEQWPGSGDASDRSDQFLCSGNLDNPDYETHLPLLWLCLEATHGPVIELGSGLGSTPKLVEYCAKTCREFKSYDGNEEWAKKVGSEFVGDWNWHGLWTRHYGLAFIDQAPAHARWASIKLLHDKADIIVVHDSQGDPEYLLDRIWYLFEHRIDDQSRIPWTTAISHTVSFESWDGQPFAQSKLKLVC